MNHRRKGGTDAGNDREEDPHGGNRAASGCRSPVCRDDGCTRRCGVRMRVRVRLRARQGMRLRGPPREARGDARQGRRAHARRSDGGRGSDDGGDGPSHGGDAGDDPEAPRPRGEDGRPEVEGRRGLPLRFPRAREAAHRPTGFAPEAHGRDDGREVTKNSTKAGGPGTNSSLEGAPSFLSYLVRAVQITFFLATSSPFAFSMWMAHARHGSKEWTVRSTSSGRPGSETGFPTRDASYGPFCPLPSRGPAFHVEGTTAW